jgi:starch-binding outer membrane protein, SusD/RagB family
MMTIHKKSSTRGGGAFGFLPRLPVAALGLALPLAACSDLLETRDPQVATPESVAGESALPAVRGAAYSDFQVAYTGWNAAGSVGDGIILISGLMADEYDAPDSFPTRVEVDQREVTNTNATMNAVFHRLQRSRVSTERAMNLYGEITPNSVGQAEGANLAGFTYLFFGENYCSGVPFSTVPDTGPIDFGAPTPRDEIFNLALARFDAALAAATAAPAGAAATAQQNLARVGRGRALINLGRWADAGSAVTNVPTAFVFNIEASEASARQNNGVWLGTNSQGRYRPANNEGVNGLPFRTSNDPRVRTEPRPATTNNGLGFDNSTPMHHQLKYPARASAVPLATGHEARLIEAEAALWAGDATAFLNHINTVRGAFTGLANATDPGNLDGRVDLLFRERAFTMWQTAHRLGDLRRLVRQYGRNSESVFPNGTFFKGGSYGSDVNFPIPFDEENNPSFTGCIDRNA